MIYALLVVTVIILSLGQIFLKQGVIVTPAQLNLESIIKTLFSPFIILGFFFYGIASILGIFLVQKLPLSVAIPSMSLAYVVILFASALFFGEKITTIKLLGVFLILVGVFFLSKSTN